MQVYHILHITAKTVREPENVQHANTQPIYTHPSYTCSCLLTRAFWMGAVTTPRSLVATALKPSSSPSPYSSTVFICKYSDRTGNVELGSELSMAVGWNGKWNSAKYMYACTHVMILLDWDTIRGGWSWLRGMQVKLLRVIGKVLFCWLSGFTLIAGAYIATSLLWDTITCEFPNTEHPHTLEALQYYPTDTWNNIIMNQPESNGKKGAGLTLQCTEWEAIWSTVSHILVLAQHTHAVHQSIITRVWDMHAKIMETTCTCMIVET